MLLTLLGYWVFQEVQLKIIFLGTRKLVIIKYLNMPCNYKLYPSNWKEIRERILKRAKNKCECCGLQKKKLTDEN